MFKINFKKISLFSGTLIIISYYIYKYYFKNKNKILELKKEENLIDFNEIKTFYFLKDKKFEEDLKKLSIKLNFEKNNHHFLSKESINCIINIVSIFFKRFLETHYKIKNKNNFKNKLKNKTKKINYLIFTFL